MHKYDCLLVSVKFSERDLFDLKKNMKIALYSINLLPCYFFLSLFQDTTYMWSTAAFGRPRGCRKYAAVKPQSINYMGLSSLGQGTSLKMTYFRQNGTRTLSWGMYPCMGYVFCILDDVVRTP